MNTELKLLNNGGVFKLTITHKHNILGSFMTLLKLVSHKNPSNFSYVEASCKEEELTIRDYLFREHNTNYQGRELRELFINKNCMHLYELIGHNTNPDEKIKNLGAEQLKIYSIITSLMHAPTRPILVEFNNCIINPKNIERIQKVFEYEAENNARLILITGNIPKNFFKIIYGNLTRTEDGKYKLISTPPTEVNQHQMAKYTA